MRKFAALAVASVSLVALVGCKSSSDSSSDTTTAGTTAETTATTVDGTTDTTEWASDDTRNPGVTADSIKIGVSYQVFSDELKAKLRTWHGDYKAMYQAYFDHVNANGGINGRTLEPVWAPYELGVDGAADAVCTKLAVEEQVFAVIGYTAGDEVLCYLDTNEIPFIGGAQNDELRAAAKVAWFSPEPSSDSEVDAITQLAENGHLDGTVAVVGTTGDQSNYDAKYKTLLEGLGVNVVDTGYFDGTITDSNVLAAAADAMIERLKSENVDQVLLIGNGAAAILFPQLAKSDFRPALRITAVGAASMFASDQSVDRSILEGAEAMGLYSNKATYRTDTDEPTKSCLDIFRGAGIELADEATWTFEGGLGKTWSSAYVVCRNMQLLTAILDRAGANPDFGSFKHAGETLGEIYLYGSPEPFNFGPGSSSDGDPGQVEYEFVLEKNAFMPKV